MKKVSIVLAVLLVAALVFGGIELSQKGSLQNALNSAQDEVKSVKSQLEEKVKELTDSSAALDGAKAELESVKTELEAKVTELTDSNAALEAAKAELETKVAEGNAALDAAKAELETKVAEGNTALESAKAELEAKITELTDGNAALEAAKAELETKVTDLEKNVQTLNDQVAAAAEQVELFATDFTGKTVIIHSNDVHGKIDGYAYIAAMKKALESAGAKVIMVDAGR